MKNGESILLVCSIIFTSCRIDTIGFPDEEAQVECYRNLCRKYGGTPGENGQCPDWNKAVDWKKIDPIEKKQCESDLGTWETFGDGCVDECSHLAGNMCTQAIQCGCNCGTERCWLVEYIDGYRRGTCVINPPWDSEENDCNKKMNNRVIVTWFWESKSWKDRNQ